MFNQVLSVVAAEVHHQVRNSAAAGWQLAISLATRKNSPPGPMHNTTNENPAVQPRTIWVPLPTHNNIRGFTVLYLQILLSSLYSLSFIIANYFTLCAVRCRI